MKSSEEELITTIAPLFFFSWRLPYSLRYLPDGVSGLGLRLCWLFVSDLTTRGAKGFLGRAAKTQAERKMASRNISMGQTARPSMASSSGNAMKTRQLTHLHSQLAQLSANLSDTENLVRMTSVQAESMRGLGAWHGGMFMAASKVLGEEAINRDAAAQARGGQR
ncbi:hypothetical protein CPAR01_10464 [Colletotrichum paranaense]|nr:uncharacterized protein CPAR01_10464 [Colletotrichum paranaense]KAK1533756.1 hypothetical protein CPAR01_10464 [Colletotrichum paranaense]